VAAVALSRNPAARRSLRKGLGRAEHFHRPVFRAAARLGAAGGGIFEMSYWRFQVANFVSALVWSAALLLFRRRDRQIIEWIWRSV